MNAIEAAAETGKRNSTTWTVVVSIGTALLTSVLAPYFLEFVKDAETRREHQRDMYERIENTQFEIIERINDVIWHYRQAAGFLMFDFSNGQTPAVLERHLKEYEDASIEANRELPTQAFRARMYFASKEIEVKLDAIASRIFRRVDDKIARQLIVDESTPHPKSQSSREAWDNISREIDNIADMDKQDLNEAFEAIGATRKNER